MPMNVLLWLGHRQGPPQLRALLLEQGIDLQTYSSVDTALAETKGREVSVAIVAADWRDANVAVEKLTAARPEIQILLATDTGIQRSVVLGLWGGASGILEFRNQTRSEIVLQIQEWVSRHRQAARERQLLLRLRALNEEFLRNIVATQKRNLELEEKLRAEQDSAEADTPARILIVDDEEVVRTVLSSIVARKSYPHELAESGEQALVLYQQAVAERRPYDLVISDKNLPGISGLDLLKQLKAMHRDTDFILVTGYASMDSAIDALNSGASAYLEKPFEHVRFVLDKIEDVLELRRERLRKRQYLNQIKDRNKAFLEQYRAIRADLEAWLHSRGALPESAKQQDLIAPPLPPGMPSALDDKGPRPWNE